MIPCTAHDLVLVAEGGDAHPRVRWCRRCGLLESSLPDLEPGAGPGARFVCVELPEVVREALDAAIGA